MSKDKKDDTLQDALKKFVVVLYRLKYKTTIVDAKIYSIMSKYQFWNFISQYTTIYCADSKE